MRKTIADLVALGGLAFASLAGGCAPGLEIPSYGPPKIVGIYGVNIAPQVQTPGVPGNGLPDFQLYALADPGNGDPHLAAPPTGPLPPAYQTLRIDFDRPMDGSTLAANPTLASAVVGPQSFCNPLPNPAIQLRDAAGAVVPSSVCYESGSSLGQQAHVYVTPGAGTLTAPPPAVSPFTCNAFKTATESNDYFKSSSTYSIRLDPAAIKSSSGQTLQLPVGAAAANAAAGWSFANNAFNFRTAGFDVMAVGYQNTATGYVYFNAKPNAAFTPFRDPIPDAVGLPCKVGDDPARPCRLGADDTPYLVFLTRPISPGSLSKANVALTRSSGASAEYSLSLGATLVEDASTGSTAPTPPDVISIAPGNPSTVPCVGCSPTWEPGETYTLRLQSGGLVSDDNLPLTGPNATSYTFTVVDAPLAAPAVVFGAANIPSRGTVNIPFTNTFARLTYLAPVATDVLGNPIGTFALKQDGTTVPSAAAVVRGQIVMLTAASTLAPETVYTVSASGVKVAAGARNAGAPQPDLAGSQFVTASLQLSGVVESGNAINRSTSVDPASLYTGKMTAVFNDLMANVTPATVVLSEAGGPPLANETVAMGTDASQWTIRVPAASEPFKFNQRYQIHFDQTIAGASPTGTGHTLKVFPCASSADCSDNEFFTTLPYAPTIASTIDAAGNLIDFTVAFKYPATPASVSLANAFYIFAKNPNGTVDLGRKIQPNCTPTPASAPTAIKCAPPAGTTFARNTTYLYGATFGGPVPGGGGTVPAAAAASPVSVTPATGPAFTVPVDPKNSTFTGSVTGTFTTGC
jgi:hypothetical protein